MKKIFRNIDWKVIGKVYRIVFVIYFCCLLIVSYIHNYYWSNIVSIFVIVMDIITLPFNFLINKLHLQVGIITNYIAFLFDILFYSFIIERIYTFIKRRKKIE